MSGSYSIHSIFSPAGGDFAQEIRKVRQFIALSRKQRVKKLDFFARFQRQVSQVTQSRDQKKINGFRLGIKFGKHAILSELNVIMPACRFCCAVPSSVNSRNHRVTYE